MPYLSSKIIDFAVMAGESTKLKSGAAVDAEVKIITSIPTQETQAEDSNAIRRENSGFLEVEPSKLEDNSKGFTSRPPSPPDSGTATPRLSIGPCPERLRPLVPPPNYGTVDFHAIYRSSFPQERNMDFVKSLKVQSVLTLVATEPSEGFRQWIDERQIKHMRVEIAANKDGAVRTTIDSLCEALLFVMDSSNHPLYIHCNQGKHRTGCVVACLRKIQRMRIDEVLTEYYAYAWPKVRPGDVDLIKSFEPEAVFEYAKSHGYFDGPQPRFTRADSRTTSIDSLAAALASRNSEDGAGSSGSSQTSEDSEYPEMYSGHFDTSNSTGTHILDTDDQTLWTEPPAAVLVTDISQAKRAAHTANCDAQGIDNTDRQVEERCNKAAKLDFESGLIVNGPGCAYLESSALASSASL